MTSLIVGALLILFTILALRSKEHAIALIIFGLPLYLVRFSLGPLPFTLLEGAVLIIFAVWVIEKRGISGALTCIKESVAKAPRPEKALYLFLYLFFLSSTVSIVFSPDLRAALGVWRAYFVEPALFFIVFLDTVKTREQMRRIISASILSGTIIALLAVYQKLTGWNIPTPWIQERRVTSAYPYPNAVGLYLAPIFWLAIGKIQELSRVKKIRHAVIVLLATGLIVAAIISSKTEAALVAITVTAIFAGFLGSAKTRIATSIIVVCSVGALFLFSPFTQSVADKLFLRDWSGGVRIATWQETIAMIQDHPLTGAGLAGYKTAMSPYHTHEYLEIFLYPHNIFLNFWSETGLYGLISFLLVCATVALLLVRVRHERVLSCAFMAAFATILIHGLVDVPYFKNDLSVQFWFLVGSTIILQRFSHET